MFPRENCCGYSLKDSFQIRDSHTQLAQVGTCHSKALCIRFGQQPFDFSSQADKKPSVAGNAFGQAPFFYTPGSSAGGVCIQDGQRSFQDSFSER
jgi:hypothetical protein